MKMSLERARKARDNFWPSADRRTRCRMAAKYARALAILGEKWVLAKKVKRRKGDQDAT